MTLIHEKRIFLKNTAVKIGANNATIIPARTNQLFRWTSNANLRQSNAVAIPITFKAGLQTKNALKINIDAKPKMRLRKLITLVIDLILFWYTVYHDDTLNRSTTLCNNSTALSNRLLAILLFFTKVDTCLYWRQTPCLNLLFTRLFFIFYNLIYFLSLTKGRFNSLSARCSITSIPNLCALSIEVAFGK